MNDQLITLIREKVVIDEYGDRQTEKTRREVFGEEKSIGQSEFYQANAAGMQPEIKFILADRLDYDGERILEYTPYGQDEPMQYTIVRTYSPGITMELTCRRGVDSDGST